MSFYTTSISLHKTTLNYDNNRFANILFENSINDAEIYFSLYIIRNF